MLQKIKGFLLLSFATGVIWGGLLSCESPLFSTDMGGKVDVVPPNVIVVSPASGDFIRGVAFFQGSATAYRALKRVEYKIFANDATGQTLVDWREVRYVNTGGDPKNRDWYLDLDTSSLNRGNDGSVKMQFRALDSTMSGETVELVYIVKNKPSVITMTTPADDFRAANVTARLVAGTDLRGQVTDRRGLKPGFPQIKIWPDDLGYEPDPNDNYSDVSNVNWGWASLFLPGVGNDVAGYDDIDGFSPDPNGGGGGVLNPGLLRRPIQHAGGARRPIRAQT
jgi:hypothetical protein